MASLHKWVNISKTIAVNTTSAISRVGLSRKRRSIGIVNSTTYHLLITTPGCRRFDSKIKKWTADGCHVSSHSMPETTECVCNKISKMSIFSAEFFVPPNTINFATVFSKINIADNPAVFSTVIVLIALYILLLVWTKRKDREDKQKWAIKSVVDNRKEDNYMYQVTIFTGHGREAATESKVSCVLFGENGKCRPRILKSQKSETSTVSPFGRSCVSHFLLREAKYLGNLTHVHVWHDNSGKGALRGWYLDQVVVQDIQTGEKFYFISDQWLAVDQDDGRVDRIIPVATAENMSTFQRLFTSTTSQKFTEDHLWISIFYRPTKSHFTRVQRLSSCVALLFLTMIANAMWFESGSRSAGGATTSLNVGPFTVSPHQIWTSFCSTLMIIPITTLIITLFKKAKTKEQDRMDREEDARKKKVIKRMNRKRKHHTDNSTLPNPSEILGKEAVYTITPDGTITAQENNRRPVIPRPNNWPYWCIYIAWVLIVLGILASGFFAILYSFEWGRDKANRWLSNMMLSFWQSVLIIQPIKVILLAMFVAAVVKKPDENAVNSIDDKEIKEEEKKFLNLCSEDLPEEDEVRAPKPPSKKRLRKARRLRENEKAMSNIIVEVFVYFFYVIILLFICHGNRDSKGFLITENIKKTFVRAPFGLEKVTSVEYFWRFIDSVLLPNLYPNEWYSGDKKSWRERSFLIDEQSYRVGPARLRQIRVKGYACPYTLNQKECRPGYSLLKNDEKLYDPGWKPYTERNTTDPDDDYDPDSPMNMAWKYQSWKESKGFPTVGELAIYPGGGYSAELGVNFQSGKEVVEFLFDNAWVDHRTRVVFAEFTVYNPNVNLFTTINLLTEFPPVGAAVHFTSIVTFRLYHYVGAYGTVMVLAQAIFVLHLLYFSYKQLKALIILRKQYFHDPWNVFDLTIFFMDWTVVGTTAARLVMTDQTISAFHEDKRKYVNFQQVTAIDSLVGYMLAISAFFGIIRFLKLLRFNKKIGMLTSVLKKSAKQWPGFFVMALVFFIAFVHIGYIVFCPFVENFRNMIAATETMIDTMMGRPTYDLMRTIYQYFGPIYYFVFCFTSLFIILNILIAIISESYGATNDEIAKQNNQYEIVDFMLDRFAKWSGLSFMAASPQAKPSGKIVPIIEVEKSNSVIESPGNEMEMMILQKRMDKYSYELENKYKKLLTFDELRKEVIHEMSFIETSSSVGNESVRRAERRRQKKIESIFSVKE